MKKEKKEPEPPRPCGFCGPGSTGDPGKCYDRLHQCRGTWNHFVPYSPLNPDGEWTCACAAAGHYLPVADAA